MAGETIIAEFEPLYFKLLARPDAILLAELCWQDDLTFRGDGGLHRGKMASYLRVVKSFGPSVLAPFFPGVVFLSAGRLLYSFA